ncbi:MAG: tRNA pseudouridine(55) synthase TruB [Candidatus Omnitrophica bacterium]|nr:tRNA pseudouridine(55) synthase TruB [Candidatus Omnitrophota bacterium]
MDGLLIVDKPARMTSHDVVNRMRRIFPGVRIGHGGTLDPMATGVLLILMGRVTKSADQLLSLDKEYEGTILLGLTTDTHDIEGKILSERPVPTLTLSKIEEACRRFSGEIEQVVPVFSAVRFGGKRGYELARAGIAVPEKRRRVNVSTLQVCDFKTPQISIRVACSKGTYVRTLAHDIGEALGCGGTLSALRRTRVGSWTLAAAKTLSELESMDSRTIEKLLL